MTKRTRTILISIIVLIAGGLLIWWAVNMYRNSTPTFVGKIEKVDGNSVYLVGAPQYPGDQAKSVKASQKQYEVQVVTTSQTEFDKTVLVLPKELSQPGKTYNPDDLQRQTQAGSLDDLKNKEIIITVTSDKSVYGQKEITAKRVEYSDLNIQ